MAERYLPGDLFRRNFNRFKLQWMRPLIILSVVVLAGAFALKLSPNQMILVMMLFGGIGAAALFLRVPTLGLIIAGFVGMVTPSIGPAGLNATIAMIAFLFGLWVIDMVVIKRSIWLIRSKTLLPVVAMIVVSLIAFGLGLALNWFNFVQNAPLDAQMGGLAIFLVSLLAFILVPNQIRDLKSLQVFTWVILIIGSIYVFISVIPPLLAIRHHIFQANAVGGIFWAWLPALTLSQAIFNKKLHWTVRALLVLVTLATLYHGFVQNYRWKSGWIPSFVTVGTILFFWSWRLVVGLGVVSLLPLIKFATDVINSDSYSVSTRVDAWIILSQIIKANPILGLGFANYYWYTPLFPIRGWAVNFNSHNNYVDLIAQTGLAGLACFLWLFWEIGRLGLSLFRRVPVGFPKAYVVGALGGLAGSLAAAMLGDWLLPFVYNIGLNGLRTGIMAWLFLGGLVVLEQLYPAAEVHE